VKAFLLAAGLGTRLYPVTAEVPKCLVPIEGRPLLEIWLDVLRSGGVDEVLINTHYLAPKVWEFAKRWRGSPKLTVTYEAALLGSAGTIAGNWDFVNGEESFLVCYADNLTNLNIGQFARFHAAHKGLVSVVLFHPENPRECGVAEVGDGGVLLSFEEKPAVPKSSLASGGVYMMRSGVRSLWPDKVPSDIGGDLLPRCLGSAYGWVWDGLLIDVGTPAGYARAQDAWAWKHAGESRL
jgi:mannose-1-phosphate guanylyltransferase